MTTVYELECVDCSFGTTVVGEFADTSEVVQKHRADEEAGPADHFVNIRRRR